MIGQQREGDSAGASQSARSSNPQSRRSVTQLTSGQLARKRAKDREAQRLTRQRTKERINHLEREIAALKQRSRSAPELRDLEEANRELEAQLKIAKEQAERRGRLSGSAEAPGQPIAGPAAGPAAMVPSSYVSRGVQHDMFSAPPQNAQEPWMSWSIPFRSRFPRPDRTTVVPIHTPTDQLIRQPSDSYWKSPVATAPPVKMIDRLIWDFIQDCRRMPQPRCVYELFNPARINVKQLLEFDPDQSAALILNCPNQILQPPPEGSFQSSHPAAHIVATMNDHATITNIFERLCALPIFTPFIGWIAFPSSQTATWVKPMEWPTPSQLSMPHALWVDLLVWSQLRDAVCQHRNSYETDEMIQTYGENLRLVNWPKELVDAVEVDKATDGMRLTEEFTEFALRAENYRLALPFYQRYPELRSCTVPLGKEDRVIGSEALTEAPEASGGGPGALPAEEIPFGG